MLYTGKAVEEHWLFHNIVQVQNVQWEFTWNIVLKTLVYS